MKKVVWGRWGTLIGTVALAALTAACASTGAVPRPFPTPHSNDASSRPAASPGSPADATGAHAAFDGYALVGAVLALRGAPYRNGGSDPAGFDCSGFTQYVYSQFGVALPREVREQFQAGKSIDPNSLSPGDLLFFSTVAPGASHVGIAIGGDEFVHAPSSTGVVRVERLSSSYWSPRYVGARRVN